LLSNTNQLYRRDSLERLKKHWRWAQAAGFNFGTKLVRGAYVVGERMWASNGGYDCPLFSTIEQTHLSYDEAVRWTINVISRQLQHESAPQMQTIIATHNLHSVQLATHVIQSEKIRLEREYMLAARFNSGICFAQLHGMSDQITLALADLQMPVYKYLPFGPVQDVIPYLIRRSEENSSVFRHVSSDGNIAIKEIASRLRNCIPFL